MKMKLLSIVWMLSLTCVLASMHTWHSLSFKAPKPNEVLSFLKPNTDLNAIHFISEGCSCSIHLINHLLERGPHQKISEKVIILGNLKKRAKELSMKGYLVDSISYQDAYENEYFSATPLLVVYDKNKSIEYMGGYTENTITPLSKIYDLEIYKTALTDSKKKTYPIKGCANSKNIQQLIDPFGLKYRRQNELI